jgi:NAD(P)H-hydrate epimerase
MSSLTLTRAESRELDRVAIEKFGIPGIVLMENAGRGCVDVLESHGIGGLVVILCGKGNNAGDGFVIARHLALRGYECRVLLLAAAEFRGDAAANFAILRKTSVPIEALVHNGTAPADLRDKLSIATRDAAWLVDALLGTGAQGNPRSPFDTAIDAINARADSTKALAVDLPSGLDCDTGQPGSPTVRADHTCTFAAMKVGFTQPSATTYTGIIHVCDIGVSPETLLRRSI